MRLDVGSAVRNRRPSMCLAAGAATASATHDMSDVTALLGQTLTAGLL